MEESLTVDGLIEILEGLSKEGYGCKPIGIETLGDITTCLCKRDVYYKEEYDAAIIYTTNI